MLIEALIILFLILLNGLFAMSEIAVVSARKPRLELEARKGRQNAAQALLLAQSPGRFLSTIQIGITSIGILTGIFSGETIAEGAGAFFNRFEWLRPHGETVGLVVVVAAVTFLSLVLGELVPKRLGMSFPETIAKAIALPMRTLSRLGTPFVWLLTNTTELVVKALRIQPKPATVTEEEIKALIEEGVRTGGVESIEHTLVERVFRLGDSRIGKLMTHRRQLVWLDLKAPFETNLARILEDLHSVYPVADGNLNRVKGILYLKDLLAATYSGEPVQLARLIRPVLSFPELVKAYEVLEAFRNCNIHYALVTDEYGEVIGFVTNNDILDELVEDETTVQAPGEIVQRENGTWLADAQLPLEVFLDFFHERELPEYEQHRFHTLAGLALDRLRQIPSTGDRFVWRRFTFEIIDMDGNRIDKILITDNQAPGAAFS